MLMKNLSQLIHKDSSANSNDLHFAVLQATHPAKKKKKTFPVVVFLNYILYYILVESERLKDVFFMSLKRQPLTVRTSVCVWFLVK